MEVYRSTGEAAVKCILYIWLYVWSDTQPTAAAATNRVRWTLKCTYNHREFREETRKKRGGLVLGTLREYRWSPLMGVPATLNNRLSASRSGTAYHEKRGLSAKMFTTTPCCWLLLLLYRNVAFVVLGAAANVGTTSLLFHLGAGGVLNGVPRRVRTEFANTAETGASPTTLH